MLNLSCKIATCSPIILFQMKALAMKTCAWKRMFLIVAIFLAPCAYLFADIKLPHSWFAVFTELSDYTSNEDQSAEVTGVEMN